MPDISFYQFPKNVANKFIGWTPDGRGLENKDGLTRLTTNTTYYLRSDATGNSGTGLENTADSAFNDLAALYNYLRANVHANGYTINIRGTGTFTGSYVLSGAIEGAPILGQVTLEAASGSKADLVFSGAGTKVTVQWGAHIKYDNLRGGSSSSVAFVAIFYGAHNFGPDVDYVGANANAAIVYTTRFGYCQISLGCEISGTMAAWVQSDHDGNTRINGHPTQRTTKFIDTPSIFALFTLDCGEITITGTNPSWPSPAPDVWEGTISGSVFFTNLTGRFQWASGDPFQIPDGLSIGVSRGGGKEVDGLCLGEFYQWDDTTAAGPTLIIERNGNPDGALLGQVAWYALNSAGTKTIMAILRPKITDWTSGSEDTTVEEQIRIAGTLTTILTKGPGLMVGTPTGGIPALGGINASSMAINGNAVPYRLSNTKTHDFASISAGASATTTVGVSGAALGDVALVSHSLDIQGMTFTGYVSAADVVTFVMFNGTAAPIDLGSGTIKAVVLK